MTAGSTSNMPQPPRSRSLNMMKPLTSTVKPGRSLSVSTTFSLRFGSKKSMIAMRYRLLPRAPARCIADALSPRFFSGRLNRSGKSRYTSDDVIVTFG